MTCNHRSVTIYGGPAGIEHAKRDISNLLWENQQQLAAQQMGTYGYDPYAEQNYYEQQQFQQQAQAQQATGWENHPYAEQWAEYYRQMGTYGASGDGSDQNAGAPTSDAAEAAFQSAPAPEPGPPGLEPPPPGAEPPVPGTEPADPSTEPAAAKAQVQAGTTLSGAGANGDTQDYSAEWAAYFAANPEAAAAYYGHSAGGADSNKKQRL